MVRTPALVGDFDVSVLFNEPKLLKFALAEARDDLRTRFSALQRAEIAEISRHAAATARCSTVSVLFNEPKLLKLDDEGSIWSLKHGFSALQRAEIAEIWILSMRLIVASTFQCSSTSRNC